MIPDERKANTDDVAGAARAAGEESPNDEDGQEPLPDPPPELEPEEVPPAPAAVAELAAACVRFVTTRYGVMLDFTPETLSLVDQWLRDARAEVSQRPESAEIVQSAAGAYLGEVIRRQLGGAWFAEGEQDGWRLDMQRVFLTFNPIGMAREALLLETADGWHAHLEMDPAEKEDVERRLEALPAADEEEYYAPTTRFEVVSIAVDALRAQMIAAGHGDVTFGPEDYKR